MGFNWATSSQKWIAQRMQKECPRLFAFQLGHFFAEMDRSVTARSLAHRYPCFNWATSSQKWIGRWPHPDRQNQASVSIGPLLRRNGSMGQSSKPVPKTATVSIGPLLSRNG